MQACMVFVIDLGVHIVTYNYRVRSFLSVGLIQLKR